jgi:hypothetical protein
MAKFQMDVTLNQLADYTTARVADGAGASNQLNDNDVGKLLKLAGDSQFGLCAVGNEIEGIMASGPDNATLDGYSVATVRKNGRTRVTLDGLQATPGTGTVAIGDFVVAGTVVARNTSLSDAPPKACKATAAATGIVHKWRVVALYGTGAVGQIALIERV